MSKLEKKTAFAQLKLTVLKGKKDKRYYLFMKHPSGSYHVFVEVAARKAAQECGAKGRGNTRTLCTQVCEF